MKEFINWVEEQTHINSLFILECSDSLANQSNTLLNILITGAGGSLAFTVHLYESKAEIWLTCGVLISTIWLFVISSIIILKCMWCKPIYGPSSDPENLLLAKGYPFQEAVLFDLTNRQYAIDANRARNDIIGRWLNICRVLAVSTPLTFFIGAVLAVY